MNLRIRSLRSTLIAPVVLLTGCASIINGTTQPMTVDSSPHKATCVLTNDYGTYNVSSTPDTITVHRSSHVMHIICHESPNLMGGKQVDSTTSAVILGNILGGGLIGGGVDAANGSAFNYPSSVDIPLEANS